MTNSHVSKVCSWLDIVNSRCNNIKNNKRELGIQFKCQGELYYVSLVCSNRYTWKCWTFIIVAVLVNDERDVIFRLVWKRINTEIDSAQMIIIKDAGLFKWFFLGTQTSICIILPTFYNHSDKKTKEFPSNSRFFFPIIVLTENILSIIHKNMIQLKLFQTNHEKTRIHFENATEKQKQQRRCVKTSWEAINLFACCF